MTSDGTIIVSLAMLFVTLILFDIFCDLDTIYISIDANCNKTRCLDS